MRNNNEILQKYALLTHSLDIICDVMYYFHGLLLNWVWASKANLHLVNLNDNEVFPLQYQDKKLSKQNSYKVLKLLVLA